MKTNSPQAKQVKSTIDELMSSVTTKDFNILEAIYHESMNIYMINDHNELNRMDKAQFIKHVSETTKAAKEPETWAEYHLVEADETNGHVLISRKVSLTGKLQKVTLSIDLVFEDDRWQITRETIFI